MARAVLLDRRLRRRDGAETQFVAADAIYAAWRRRDGTVFRTSVAALTVWKQGTGTGQRGFTPSAMLRRADSIMCERSEEHTSELQSLMRISYAVFCFNKKKKIN